MYGRISGNNAARAIYGQILSTAVVATLSEDEEYSVPDVLLAVVISTLVFWIAHVYAESAAQRLNQQENLTLRQVAANGRSEGAMVLAAIPTVLVLSLGGLEALSRDLTLDLAIALGVAELVGLGLVIARRSKMGVGGTIGSMLLTASLGMLIVGLKTVVH